MPYHGVVYVRRRGGHHLGPQSSGLCACTRYQLEVFANVTSEVQPFGWLFWVSEPYCVPEGATYADSLVRAASVRLEPCALEAGPHLRLNYLDQPEGPYLTVASVLLRTDESLPNGFYLRRLADGLWLRGYASGLRARLQRLRLRVP